MKVWTFIIRGQGELRLQIPFQPLLNHQGGQTLWKFVGTEKAAHAIEDFFGNVGYQIEKFTENDDQKMRKAHLSPAFPYCCQWFRDLFSRKGQDAQLREQLQNSDPFVVLKAALHEFEEKGNDDRLVLIESILSEMGDEGTLALGYLQPYFE